MFPNDLWIIEPNTDASSQENGKLHKVVNDSPTSGYIAVEQNARAICVSQDMVTIYLANRDKNSVSIIKNNTFAGEIYVGKTPYGICEDHNKDIWVTNYSDNTVSKISKGSVVKTIAVDPGPKGICCDSNGDIYVACFLSSTVAKISSDIKVSSIEVGQNPEGITCDSFDNIWTANYGSNTISKITRGIKILDVEVGRAPIAIVADSSGTVFVANYMGNDVTSVSNVSGKIVTTTIPVGAGPTAIAVTQDDSIYVTVGLEDYVAKIVKNTMIGKISVCENPSGFGDFTGCATYNVFNAIPAPDTGESTTIPEGGWYITQLQPDIQKAINAVNANMNPNGTLGMKVEDIYYKASAGSTEETIENVKQALDVIYSGKAPQNVESIVLEDGTPLTTELNKAEFIIVGKNQSNKDITLTVKLNEIDSNIASIQSNMNNPDGILIGDSSLTNKLQDIDASISKLDGLQSSVENISADVNNPDKIFVTQEPQVSLTQKLQEMQTAQESTQGVVDTIYAQYNKPEYIDMGSGEMLPTTISNINTKIDQNVASVESVNQAITALEGKANDPNQIMIGESTLTAKLAEVDTKIADVTDATGEVDDKISAAVEGMNDPDKIMLGDKSLTTKLGELDTTDTNTNDRLVDIETTFNKPEYIMVETEKSLKTKLSELDQKNAESTTNIDGLTVRVSDIESKYNKPDQIVVDEENSKTLDVKLSEMDATIAEDINNLATNYYTKTDINMKEEANNDKFEEMDTRVATIEESYNKPENIMMTEDKNLVQKVQDIDNALTNRYTKADADGKFATIETTDGIDNRVQDIESKYNKPDQIVVSAEEVEPAVTLADKLATLDQTLADGAANLKDNYYTKIDADAKFETIETVTGVNERLTTVESRYNKPEKIIVEKADVEGGPIPDKTLDVKLTEIDTAISKQTAALDEFKESIPQNYYNKTEVDTKFDEVNSNLTNNYYNKAEIDNKDQELNTKIADNTKRIADIETKYNKPDQIVVEEGKTLDVKLTEIDAAIQADKDNLATNYYTKEEVDAKENTLNESITAVSDRVTAIEDKYNDPDQIMIGETSLSDTITNINAEIDTKADAEDLVNNYYTKVDADDKFATNDNVDGINTRLTDVESKYNDPEQIIVDTDSATSLKVKLDQVDDLIDTKANASDVYSIEVADSTFATISTVNGIDDRVKDIEAVYNKPDNIIVDEDSSKNLTTKLSEMDTTIAAKADSATLTSDYYNKTDADGKFATIETLNTTKSTLEQSVTGVSDRVTVIEGKYNDPDQIMLDDTSLTDTVDNINTSITDLKNNKADKTALDAYTTTEVLTATYSTKKETTAVSDRVTTIEGKYNDPTKIMIDTATLSDTIKTIKSSIESLTTDKANASDVYTTETADSLFATKTELSAYDTVESVNSKVKHMNDPDYIMIGDDTRASVNLTDKLATVDTTLAAKADTTTVESTYATKQEMTSQLATKADAATLTSDYATKTEVTEGLALKADTATVASTYATKESVSDMLTKTEARTTYATSESVDTKFEAYTTTEDLTDLLDGKVDNADISDMLTKTEAGSKYATKTEIADMATNSAVASTYATKAEVTTQMNNKADKTAISDMLTKTEASSTYITPSAVDTKLEAYTNTEELTDLLDGKVDDADISDMATNAAVASTYATKVEVSAKADKSAISDMATNTVVASTYATKESISDMLTKSEASTKYATKDEVSAKADTSAIADMLTKTEAGSTYATKATVDEKADKTAIADMATKTEVASTYATKSEVSAKADASAISDMATNASVAAAYATKESVEDIAVSVPTIVIPKPTAGGQIYEFITEQNVQLTKVDFFTAADANITENIAFDVETCAVGASSYTKLGETHTLEVGASGNYKSDDVSASNLTINASTRVRINISSIQADSISYLAVKFSFKKHNI